MRDLTLFTLLITPFLGCASVSQSYLLNDGILVRCKTFSQQTCGVYLGDCEDGDEYYCQTNVEELYGTKRVIPEKEKPDKISL